VFTVHATNLVLADRGSKYNMAVNFLCGVTLVAKVRNSCIKYYLRYINHIEATLTRFPTYFYDNQPMHQAAWGRQPHGTPCPIETRYDNNKQGPLVRRMPKSGVVRAQQLRNLNEGLQQRGRSWGNSTASAKLHAMKWPPPLWLNFPPLKIEHIENNQFQKSRWITAPAL
jgi:hypothetical protein